MQLLRWSLVGCLIVGLAGCGGPSTKKPASPAGSNPSTGQPKPKPPESNKDKIIGTWELTKGGGETAPGSTFEFTKDGKTKMTAKVGDKTINMDATYKVEGNKLLTTAKGPDGKEDTNTDTIVKLTDTEMVLESKEGKVEFKKKK